jgi:Capsule assembly protein Wzi
MAVLLCAGVAQASVNLPLHHWSYSAIEQLTALGIIEDAMVVTKPYSRKEAAKYVAQAIERIRADQVAIDGREAIAERLLERLMAEFRPELIMQGLIEGSGTERTGSFRYGARVQSEMDAFFVGGGQTVRFRENRGGEYYANGLQNQTDLRGWFEVEDWAALVVQPKFISNRNALSEGPTIGPITSLNSHYAYLRELSLKLSFRNIALEVGRGTQWWGPGYHGSLLLTNHAFPLDMIKLGSDEAFYLPWVFRDLGKWKVNSFLAQLEEDRDFSHAKIFGLRVNYLPASWLEIGLTRLTQFGGQGRGQSFPQTVVDCYKNPPNQTAAQDCNEQSMIDFRARIPRIPYLVPFPAGMQIYGELGSEDKWSKIPIPSRAAFLAGIYIPQLYKGDTQDLRIEYADTDYTRRKIGGAGVWYNNSQFTSGMRQNGFPLGHAMGTDAIDIYIRTSRYLTEKFQVAYSFNHQERGRGLPVQERKQESSIDLTYWVSVRMQVSLGYTRQSLKNPGQISDITSYTEQFASGVTATNHLLWTSVAMEF